MNEKYYCPVNGWDCPYWQKDGSCTCENPTVECDDAAWWEDYFNDLDDDEEQTVSRKQQVAQSGLLFFMQFAY